MHSHPLISIIIPTYNRCDVIGETLHSILSQSYINWECLIIDDGSNDDTDSIVGEFVKKDSRFKYFIRSNRHNSGGNGARNYGLELSKGLFVNFFDDDDLMHPLRLEIQMDKIKTSNLPFVVCNAMLFEKHIDNTIGLRHDSIWSERPLYDYITGNIVVLTMIPIIRKEFLLTKNIIFNENLKAAQEWSFLCKLFFYSPDYLFINKPLVFVRKHVNSITHNSSVDRRAWSYYLAREEIYKFLQNKSLKDKVEIFKFLEKYFEDFMIRFLFEKKDKQAQQVFHNTLMPNYSIFKRIRVWLYMNFVSLTGIGYKFRYWIYK